MTEEKLNDLRAEWILTYSEYVGNITGQAVLEHACQKSPSAYVRRELRSDIKQRKARQKELQEHLLKLEQVPEIKKFADAARADEK